MKYMELSLDVFVLLRQLTGVSLKEDGLLLCEH